ncbi:MAG: Acetyl-CoA acetyltransferase [Planctomycetes bacterium]|nr:Acetyl-CoA acetyltransferase [Planctomycetota bacterium]
MALENVFIPYGGYWASPFVKWQGTLADENSVTLAAATAARWLKSREISPEVFTSVALGFTVPQKHSFYGAPWLAGLIGAPGITGPMYSQACATGARVIAGSAHEIEAGLTECVLGVTFDRCSNGPHVVYPAPNAPGGTADAENWVMDNFNKDPYAKNAMIQTAENTAKAHNISREEQDECTLIRHQQYLKGAELRKRTTFAIEVGSGKRAKLIETDDGVFPTTKEGLANLKPVLPDGTVTFGAQTHPADGNAGMIITTRARAEQLSRDKSIPVQVLSFGQCRVGKGLMPTAPVPAAQQAMKAAGVELKDIKAIKTHNPFAVNDVYFAKQTGKKLEEFNNYGSPLIFGHPQGPTGMRVIIELIEELAQNGGGHGLFTGCAAGDTAMATVIKVG